MLVSQCKKRPNVVLCNGRQLKGTVHPKINTTYFFFSPILPFTHLDCFDVSCRVLEISAVEISAFSLTMKLHCTCLVVLKAVRENMYF